ncbi:MAG TPA: hypothetical protein PKK10_04525 [Woeseiaceae bacterium]|nr:hypothetical protein [Woeseiaceae bacterium]
MSWLRRWNDFWFQPGHSFDLAFIRLVLVGLQCFVLLSYSFPALTYALSLPEYLYEPRIVTRLLMPWAAHTMLDSSVVLGMFWIAFLFGLTSFLGLFTNFSLLVFAFLNILLQAFIYSFGDVHHPEAVMMLALVALALSPSGRVLSIDAWWRARRQRDPAQLIPLLDHMTQYARWPIVFLQCFFPLMYLSAVVSKLTKGGFDWANGISLQYYMILEAHKNDSALALYVSQFHYLLKFAEYIVLTFQATFFLILFFPRLKWIYLPLGIIFHTVIYVTLRAPFPQWIAMYIVYIPWALAFTWLAQKKVSDSAQLSP